MLKAHQVPKWVSIVFAGSQRELIYLICILVFTTYCTLPRLPAQSKYSTHDIQNLSATETLLIIQQTTVSLCIPFRVNCEIAKLYTYV